jgi:broad specificity polyphosphatase/5'/3'-nucleotidase SurE
MTEPSILLTNDDGIDAQGLASSTRSSPASPT